MTEGRDYRDTLNLPKTGFPMKAELPKREPERLVWWQEHRVYERRLERNERLHREKPHDPQHAPWILHDGPPYANGELHMGHFLNMVLKDVFVKIALLDGKVATFVPGWDMHGLPIELETLKYLGIKDFHAIDPLELRAKCKERAFFWLDRQSETRQRMGNFGNFEHPYRTIDPSFEATIVDTLASLAENQQIYKGLRATLWCIHDETALAEAEIEYEQKKSHSIYVRFAANDAQREALLAAFDTASRRTEEPLAVLIWTTTPWTLPANAAIALRADAEYGLYRIDGELLIVATALAPKALGDAFARAERIATTAGEKLDGLAVRHPFMDRDSILVLADYVDLETGTGAVHTAPGHGADDFETGIKYNLQIISPVDAAGKFTSDAGPYAGMHIWKADPKIVEDLRASGALFRDGEYEHSYPHCWRCHNPVIFRATAQWFIAMDLNHLRQRAIGAAEKVAYTPDWGKARLQQMLENHPEWCISRQRTWGTPIPALICRGCNESFLDPAVARKAAARFAEAGADSWWRDDVATFVPEGMKCPNCGAHDFEKEKNIVDIWFESGVTHFAVLGKEPYNMPWPSDLVLEGGDQYRGWFRSSLVTAVAVKNAAPYKHVVKNGWVNDEEGRPMSKSRGTGIDARDAMGKWGADVLRLWGASVEFVDDVRFGPNVAAQVGNVYRNIRNRIRFMLSNLYDLPASEIIARGNMHPLDRMACAMADALVVEIKEWYDAFEIHDAYLRIVSFESSMSSFYFDALKDPLYTRAANGERRRSAQSALLYILKSFLVVTASVLSFTAEEAWQHLSAELRDAEESVFDLSFDTETRKHAIAGKIESERALWELLGKLRAKIASSEGRRDLELQATVKAGKRAYDQLIELGEDLREALVVSQVTVEPDDTFDERNAEISAVAEADGQKCARCWKYRELGTDPEHPEICADCAAVLLSPHGP